MDTKRYRILVCRGPQCGGKRGSAALVPQFKRALAQAGAAERCELRWQSCFGRCTMGPNVMVRELDANAGAARFLFATLPGRGGKSALYNRVSPDRVTTIVERHVGRGEVVREYIERAPLPGAPKQSLEPSEPSESPLSREPNEPGEDG